MAFERNVKFTPDDSVRLMSRGKELYAREPFILKLPLASVKSLRYWTIFGGHVKFRQNKVNRRVIFRESLLHKREETTDRLSKGLFCDFDWLFQTVQITGSYVNSKLSPFKRNSRYL